MMIGHYYPPSRPPPRASYPRYPRRSRQPLLVVLLVILFAGLLLTSTLLIVQWIYRPPSITHTPVTIGLGNSPISISALVFGGGSWVQNATLFYNVANTAVWKTKMMTPTSGSEPYVGVIPGSDVTSSITYYITAVNGLGLSANTVGYFILVREFNISAQLPTIVLSAGTSNSTTVTVGSKGGFSSSVSLSMSGLPSGVTASFNPPAVTPPPDGTVTSNMIISSTTSAPAGIYTTSLTGSSGNLTQTSTMTVKVNPPGDFGFSVTPNILTIRRGAAAFYNVTMNAENGYVHAVMLSASGLPTNIRYTFTTFQNETVIGEPFQHVTLMVTTNGLSPIGTFTITVQATDGTLTHTAQVTLTVQP